MTSRVELDLGESSVLGETIISTQSSDLAKQNLICHMNYSNYL